MRVNFGLQLPTWAAFPYEEVIEQAILAERAGFNYICVPDHFFLAEKWYRMFKATYERCDPMRRDMFDPWVILSAVASITKKVKLGPGVTPVPYYNPARLAKIVVTLDHVSNGRVIFGAGAGWHREEANCYNVPWENFATRIKMMNEGIEMMKKLWTADAKVTWKSKYYRVEDAPAWPKPIQKPYPPIWHGGRGGEIVEAVGKLGDGWCPFLTTHDFTPQVYKEKWNRIKDLARKVGRDPTKIIPSSHIIISMEKDYDRAFQKYVASIRTLISRGLTENKLTLKHGIFGTAEDCINRLEKYVEAGVRHFVLNPYPHPDDVREFFKTFSEKIIPYFNEGV
jgi:probable F420-dependent oxidoreductase